MEIFLRVLQSLALLGIAASLGGCVTYYGPGTGEFEKMSDHAAYALVRYVHPGPNDSFVSKYCDHPDGRRDPLCQDRSTIDHISIAIGRNSWGIKIGGLLVPKAVNIRVGDVVEVRYPTDDQPYIRFLRIAAREADTDRLHCGWVGSKIAFSGGVVCDGWRYDKDFPLLAN